MRLTLRGYSTALYATWHAIPELGLLFDAGDGVCAGLLGKTGALRHVFLSHADRDHLTGLLQLVQLNPLGRRLQIHYPADCGSFPALAAFCQRFDPHVDPPTWLPIRHGDEVAIGGDRHVLAVRNPHVPHAHDPDATDSTGATHKSLSYFVVQRKRKLKAELDGLPQKEIVRRIRTEGRDAVTDLHEHRILGYSADTPILPASFWAGSRVLIHEATFLTADDAERRSPGDTHRHSTLPQVLPMVAQVRPQHLVLTHFSTRYSHERIQEAVQAGIEEHGLDFDVHVVLPGERYRVEVKL